jgi:hypothetical protein
MTDVKSLNSLLNDWLDEINIYCNTAHTVLLILGNKNDSSVMETKEIKDKLNKWNNGALVDLESGK